ncbi:MAG: mechanosensitive ion channel family protein, partial [Candidatus Helarchaeota archaeon]
GIRLVCIILTFIIFIYMSPWLFIGGIPPEIAVILASITGTIITLSSITVIQNFIAGLYIVSTRPYGIGDYIKIGGHEGIVEEISLNHTKLRMPSGLRYYISNSSVINSKIINYNISREKFQQIMKKFNPSLKESFLKTEIVRYAFTLELPKENPLRTRQILKEICKKYEKILNHQIEFKTIALTHKAIINFILNASDPVTIMEVKPQLIQDIYQKLFSHQ